MKKIALVLTLAALMMAFASVAMAAQVIDPSATLGDGKSDYLATDKNFAGFGSQTNYPNGIYLPYQNPDGTAGKIHSAYNRNTDACAACHATHTAVGEALLQWDTLQDTCLACHDGTITQTYNVQDGYISGTSGARTMGGLFGFSGTDGVNSLSKHNVDTAGVILKSAPGGNFNATTGTWMGNFECISCHDPHGKGGNYRILNPDVNGVGDTKTAGETLTTTDNTNYKASKGEWLLGYPMGYKIYKNGTAISTGYTVDARNGIVTFAAANLATDVITADYYPGLAVTGTVTNKLLQTESSAYTDGINAFCGACHVDYNTSAITSPSSNLSGTYTEAYRHKVGRTYSAKAGLTLSTKSEFTCLTCHVAHGTDKGWWTDWAVKSGWQGVVSDEIAGSSALKRLPNMSVCEACHGKGINNYNY